LASCAELGAERCGVALAPGDMYSLESFLDRYSKAAGHAIR
jgi:hypothetical protein